MTPLEEAGSSGLWSRRHDGSRYGDSQQDNQGQDGPGTGFDSRLFHHTLLYEPSKIEGGAILLCLREQVIKNLTGLVVFEEV